MSTEQPEIPPRPLYQQTPAIITALILFAPLGLFLMWRYRPWSRRAQWIITGVIVGLWTVLIVVGAVTDTGDEDTQGESVSREEDATDTPEPPEETETDEATEVPEATETPEPTEPPDPTDTPEPPPTPEPGFGDGTHAVGQDIQPGTYRSTGDSLCYWARLLGFSGELDDIITNGNEAPEIVTIAQGDVGFETQGCGRWVPVAITAPAVPAPSFGDGTYQVGIHIEPGQYRADGEGLCYWARLSDFSQELDGIIANGNDPTIVDIAPTDAGFTTFGCGTWTRR